MNRQVSPQQTSSLTKLLTEQSKRNLPTPVDMDKISLKSSGNIVYFDFFLIGVKTHAEYLRELACVLREGDRSLGLRGYDATSGRT